MFSAASRGIPSFGDLSWHAPVVAAALPNDTILSACTLSAGVSPSFGQTLTKTTNGALTAEPAFASSGVVAGARVLVAQGGLGSVPANASGIYVVTQLGDGTHPWRLTRATDADSARELPLGSITIVYSSDVGVAHYLQMFMANGAAWLSIPQIFDYLKSTGIIGPATFDGPGGAGTDAILITGGDATFGAGGVGAAGGAVRRGTASVPGGPFDALVPPGTIVAYGGTAAPDGWLLCQGQSLARTDYPDLFAVIGTAFGSVDGTHFTLPDLRGRFPLGKAAAGTGSTLGGTGGAIDHTHTGPSHSHSHSHQSAIDSSGGGIGSKSTPNWGQGSAFTANRAVSQGTVSISSHFDLTDTDATAGGTGATGAANPPFQAVNYMIHV